jgi:hypothetical protein
MWTLLAVGAVASVVFGLVAVALNMCHDLKKNGPA